MAPVPVQEGAMAHLDVVRTEARHLLGGGPVVLAAQRHAFAIARAEEERELAQDALGRVQSAAASLQSRLEAQRAELRECAAITRELTAALVELYRELDLEDTRRV